MKRLVALGLAVAAAAVVGWWLLGRSAADQPAPAAPAPVLPVAPVAPTASRPAPHLPSLPAQGSDEVVHEGSDPKAYSIGGVEIRDHRDGTQKPLDMTPNLHAPDSRRLASAAVALITGKVKAGLYQCANDIPREARGAQPKLEGQIKVSIKDHVLKIEAAEAKVRDVVGAAVEPTQRCIEQKAIGQTIDVPDEADVAEYTISMSYLIP